MYAVIRTGASQHIVQEGEKVRVPLLKAEPGAVVKFDDVLLVKTDSDVAVGKPRVENAFVEAKVIAHVRNPKVTIHKFIRRENYRRIKGHKQPMTEVEVSGIRLA
jgi:large subunit ribosomal protein L21